MVVLDVETTGLDPVKNTILEIGAIDFYNPEYQFYGRCRMDERFEIDSKALAINGYSEKDLFDSTKPTLGQMLKDFKEWVLKIKDRTLAGQNVSFDMAILSNSAKVNGVNLQLGYRNIDQHSLAYSLCIKYGINIPLENGISALNGDRIMSLVGLPEEPRPHSGINGAKYQAEAISRMVYGRSLLPEFSTYKIPDYSKIKVI
jgi:hypothetical protein